MSETAKKIPVEVQPSAENKDEVKGKEATGDNKKPQVQQQPQSSFTMVYIFLFLMAMLIMFSPSSRDQFVLLVDFIIYPTIGFSGKYPLLTITLLSAFFMIFLTALRNYHTDWVSFSKSQLWSSYLSKLQFKYMKEGKKDKMKEVTDLQNKLAGMQMKVMGGTLKYFSTSLFFIVLIFSWIAFFIALPTTYIYYTLPWNFNSDLGYVIVLPSWVILYSVMSAPFSLLFYKLFKYYSLKKELPKYLKQKTGKSSE
ncbi:MAG: hypothetical protein ACP5RS_02280 [Thermoplasmata archaeon]